MTETSTVTTKVAIDRAKAEAKKFQLEGEAAHLTAQAAYLKAEAEARKLAAEAEIQEHLAVKARNDAEREAEKRAEEKAGDRFHLTYLFDSDVNEAAVKKCVAQLATWERTASEPITVELVINSPGGSVVDGFALIDYIVGMGHRGHTVNTTAYGMAASMGGVLLQVGKRRSMGANAVLLIHEAQFGAVGSYGAIEDRVKLVDIFHDRILSLFTARASVTRQFIKKNWARTDWWLSAESALQYGFVDEVR